MCSDKELLDWLEEQNSKGSYTGRCIFRWSSTGRGWRLHETDGGGFNSVRYAIEKAIEESKEEQPK